MLLFGCEQVVLLSFLPQSHLFVSPVYRIRLCKGRPLRGRGRGLSFASLSMEGKVLFDILDVSGRNKTRFTESAFALAALALKQVAFSLMTAKYLPGASDFEALGDGLPCFCFSSYSWHGARNLTTCVFLASRKWKKFQEIGPHRPERGTNDVNHAIPRSFTMSCLRRECRLFAFFRKDLDPDGSDAIFDKAELFGGSYGDIDDPAFFVGAAIIDRDDFGFVVRQVDDADLGAHGQGFVGSGGRMVAKFLATGGTGAGIGFDGIPGCLAFLDRLNDVWLAFRVQAAGATGDEDETCESQHRGLFDFPCV